MNFSKEPEPTFTPSFEGESENNEDVKTKLGLIEFSFHAIVLLLLL